MADTQSINSLETSATTSSNNTNTGKKLQAKEVSRILKKCQWCMKSETDLGEKFKYCSKCKATVYCSRECQVAAWKLHKNHCNTTADNWKRLAEDPDAHKKVSDFKKWHAKFRNELAHAAMCALNLGERPENIEKKVFLLSLGTSLKSEDDLEDEPDPEPEPTKKKKYSQKYIPLSGYVMSIDEAKGLLGPSSEGLFNQLKANNRMAKTKAAWMGTIALILQIDDIVDFVMVMVPTLAVLRSNITRWDWRENPIDMLAKALEDGVQVDDPTVRRTAVMSMGDNGKVQVGK